MNKFYQKLVSLFVGGLIVLVSFFGLNPLPAQAVLQNGANATNLLGQYDWADVTNLAPAYTTGTAGDTPNRLGYADPLGVAVDTTHHRLFVADSSNNRVLVYNLNSDNSFPDRVPDKVLGQSNFYTNTDGSAEPSASSLGNPTAVRYDSGNDYLYVSDTSTNRVVVFDVATITNGENAIYVLGQADFTTVTQDGPSDFELSGPTGLALDTTGHRLFVADTQYSRIMVFDVSEITNGQSAANVLGSPDFTTSTGARTQSRVNQATGLSYDSTGSRLFVADNANNRVLIYSVSSITNGQNAAFVLGQTTFTAGTSGLTQGKFNISGNSFVGVSYDSTGSRLFVADGTNRRVMVFSVSSITNGQNAINVLGQSNFTTNTGVYTQASTYFPQGLAYDGTNLYVADSSARRMMVFDVASITNGENAVNMTGQSDGTSISDPQPLYTKGNSDDVPNRWGYNNARGIVFDTTHHRLFIADGSNNRVMVYNLNSDDTLVDRIPDYVLGQPDFVTTTANTTQAGLNSPGFLAYDSTGDRLFVGQANNNRVSVFDTASISNGENAINVLGQADFTSSSAATTQAGLNNPQGLAYDAVHSLLYVVQLVASRVSVFDVASITDGENATHVLGQADFTSSSAATTQAGLSFPVGVAYDAANERLFVAGAGNNRVTVYDVASITDGENATHVLGQADFTSSSAATTQAGINNPNGLAYDSTTQRLFVVQNAGNRVTVFDVASITDGENAINLIGQSSYTSSDGSLTQAGLGTPIGVGYNSTTNELYVSQGGSANRVSVFDAAFASFNKSTTTQSVTVGTPGTFTVYLTAQPSSDVVIDVTSSDSTAATVSPSSLTFTSSNWSTPQTVTTTAITGGNSLTTTLSIDTDASDEAFGSVADQTIALTTVVNPAAQTTPTTSGGGGSGGSYSAPAAPSSPAPTTNTSNPISTPNQTNTSKPDSSVTPLCVKPSYPTAIIRFNRANNSAQVKLLQSFLNLIMGTQLAVDGSYKQADRAVVIAFQEKYAKEILAPQGLRRGTGFVYTRTLAKIKQLAESYCQ